MPAILQAAGHATRAAVSSPVLDRALRRAVLRPTLAWTLCPPTGLIQRLSTEAIVTRRAEVEALE